MVDQASLDNLFGNLVYTLGAFAVILVVLALGIMDAGGINRKNLLDNWVTKITGAFIAGAGTLIIGYALWQWSFYQAFGYENPLWSAISDWWLGGAFMSVSSSNIDAEALAGADVQQIFGVYFATFSGATFALIHSGLLERVRRRVLFTFAAAIGILSPLASYLTWGPVGPLTVLGVHDIEGIFPLYIFAGTWVLVAAWRIGPRVGAFAPHRADAQPPLQNIGLVAVGALLICFALPFVILGATWIIPGEGVFGIAYTETGWGLLITNTFVALAAGAVAGAVIARITRIAVFAITGPIAGVVMVGTLLDIGHPLEVLVIAMFGPGVMYLAGRMVARLGIDDPKVIPLGLGPGLVGAIVTGFVAWGTRTGGYPGLDGQYALGVGEINPLWQLTGAVTVMALAAIPCLAICFFFERFGGGLRVAEQWEIAGLDASRWGTASDQPTAPADHPTGAASRDSRP